MTAVPRQMVTNALRDLLRGQAISVYESGTAGERQAPYVVLASLTDGRVEGQTLGDEVGSVWSLGYQLDSVGARRDQAEWMGDRTRDILSRRETYPIVLPTGWLECGRLLLGAPGGATAQSTAPSRLYAVQEQWIVQVVPA